MPLIEAWTAESQIVTIKKWVHVDMMVIKRGKKPLSHKTLAVAAAAWQQGNAE
jgi:hypothetical protein